MLEALEEHFGDSARWTTPRGGLFVWATLDERIDTTDLLALARKSEGVAFVPGRAAYMDGRRGSSSMRLNFAGIPEQDIREGIRRIGRGVREQLGLLGTLTGSPVARRTGRGRRERPRQRRARGDGDEAPSSWPTSSSCRRREDARRHAAAATMSARRRVAVLKGGRSLERSVSLRSGAQVQDALAAARPRGAGVDVGESFVPS